jgi:hypothetical protein
MKWRRRQVHIDEHGYDRIQDEAVKIGLSREVSDALSPTVARRIN